MRARKVKKPTAFAVGLIAECKALENLRFFKGSDTSSANVTVHFLSVFNVVDFLYVYLERSSRFTVGVAYVVARRLTFTANIAYSGHINTSDFWVIFF